MRDISCGVLLLLVLGACSESSNRSRSDMAAPTPCELGSSADLGTTADLGKSGEPTANPFPVVSGKATWYDANGDGACSFGPSPNDLMVAAMNQPQYLGSQACGACVKVIGPSGTVTVRIVDLCPECQQGHVDLSQQAFAKIAAPELGEVPVTWQYVPCAVSGPIGYHFKDGSNQWWTAIQVRNTRYAVQSLAAKQNGVFVPIPREDYNYFVAAAGLGPGPYELCVVDVLGHQLLDTGIPHQEGQVVQGSSQFPQ